MEKYLKEMLGEDNVFEEQVKPFQLPLFLKNYSYKVYSIYGSRYVFVESQNPINIKVYKNIKPEVEKLFGCLAVIILKKSNTDMRKNLIQNGIMFVEVGKQLFMPMIGVSLSDRKGDNVVEIVEKFTPQTQMVALFFAYNKSEKVSSKDIEIKTELNSMSVCRALMLLEQLGLIKSENVGRKKLYSLAVEEKDYVYKLLELAIYPVAKTVMVEDSDLPDNKCVSSYKALSNYSMISPDNDVYAISKEEYKKIQDKCEDYKDKLIYDDNLIKCEVWKYDPNIFARNSVVDTLSLVMTFDRDNIDERTESALEEVLGDIKDEI